MIRRLLMDQKDWDRDAVIEDGRAISYGELMHKAMALQPLLPRVPEERVAIYLPNGGDYIAAFWAVVQVGMTAFPLNASMTRDEVAALLKQASVKCVITASGSRQLFEDAAACEDLSLRIITIDELRAAAHTQAECWGEPAAMEVPEDSPMVLLPTSGTTGKSKIVRLSERNVAASLLGYLDKMRFAETDARFALGVPFSSVYGLMILSACLRQSYPIVILPSAFTLDSFYRTVEQHRVTHYEGSASVIHLMEQMAGRPIPYDVRALTYFGFGGSKVSGKTVDAVHRAYPGVRVFQGYGMTEAAPLITKFLRSGPIKSESSGTAIQGADIAVAIDGRIVHAPYAQGEIVVSGANVMLGYDNNEEETERVLRDGYLYTGDIGYLDEEGYLYLCGRKKNIIIVRGFNVYPEEVEACIRNSALAKDCHVHGEADALGGERVCADVVAARPGIAAGEIALYCRTHLAAYKQPQRIAMVDCIDRAASWKSER